MSAERIAALESQLAAAQATIRDQARALEENARRERERDALRIEQERESERQRVLRRERNARHRAARRQGDASETPVRRSGDVSETSHPSFSSPPLDGPPLSSQTHLSPPLYPLPASSSPLAGSEPRPPVSHTSADELSDATEHAELEPNPSETPNGSNHPKIPESSPRPATGMPARAPETARQSANDTTPLPLALDIAPPPSKRAPERKAARKVVDGEKPPDPRHAPLVKALCAVFLEHTGAAYAFSGRSAKTVSALLVQADCAPDTRGPAAHDAVLQRWRWGLGWVIPLSNRRPVQTLEQLLMNWNDLAREPPRPEAPRSNPNAPTQATEWDWTGAATGKESVDA